MLESKTRRFWGGFFVRIRIHSKIRRSARNDKYYTDRKIKKNKAYLKSTVLWVMVELCFVQIWMAEVGIQSVLLLITIGLRMCYFFILNLTRKEKFIGKKISLRVWHSSSRFVVTSKSIDEWNRRKSTFPTKLPKNRFSALCNKWFVKIPIIYMHLSVRPKKTLEN